MFEQLKAKIKVKIGGSLSKTIFKNSSFNAARTVFLAFLSFVTIPIILHKLGTENYGVWALVIAFASYANFLELGFNSAVTRLVAQSSGKAINVGNGLDRSLQNENNVVVTGFKPVTTDKNNVNHDIADQINSTVITYIFVSVFIFMAVLLLYPLIKSFMFAKVSVPNLDLYILGTLFLYFLNLVTSNYLSVLTGRMRMDITNGISIFTSLLQTGLTVGLLYAGYGLMAVFVGSAASGILGSLLPTIFAKREFPELFFSFKKYSFSKIKPLFKFSMKMYFINSVSNFLSSTNKFIIVRLTGLDFVAYYEIANKVVLQLRILFSNILEPVYPAASMVVSSENGSRMTDDGDNVVVTGFKPVTTDKNMKIVKAYNKAFRYLLIISLFGYGAMILFSYPVFLVWLGKKYTQVCLITIIMGIGNFFNLQTAIPFFFLSAMNKLQKPMISAILVLISNFLFSFIGFHLFGFYGMISGFSLALILPAVWFVVLGRKEVVG